MTEQEAVTFAATSRFRCFWEIEMSVKANMVKFWAATLLLVSAFDGSAQADEHAIRGVNAPLIERTGSLKPPIEELVALNKSRVKLARSNGFNFLRILLPMEPFLPSPSADMQNKALRLARETVGTAIASDLGVEVAFEAPSAIGTRGLVCDGRNRDEFKAAIIQYLKVFPDTSQLAVEAMNEPPSCPGDRPGAPVWGGWQAELYQAVHSITPHARFVVTAGGWGGLDGLIKFDPAPYKADPHALFTFHFYEPFLYTHQQAGFLRADHLNQYVQNLTWPYEARNAGQVREAAIAALQQDRAVDAGKRQDGSVALRKMFDEFSNQGTPGFVGSRFDLVQKWAVSNGIPADRILLGEFGVRRPAEDGGKVGMPWTGSASWLGTVRKAAEARHMGWMTWDLDSGFGVVCAGAQGTGKLCPDYATALGLKQ